MRSFFVALCSALVTLVAASQAWALADTKRVALVIGNSAYVHAVALPNPVGDAKLMAATLRDAGFTVIEGSDVDKAAMGKLVDQFTEAAYDADIALIYYAGHGLQVDGRNYLIPVDAQLEKAAQLQTRTIPVDDLLRSLPPDPAVGIIILDACRDNPLARTLAAALPASRSASMGAGLAAVQANGESHGGGGLLIAYATDPGSVAYDGKDAHSPYTAALARHLATPGLEIQSALTRVRADVSEATKGAQRPWHNASLAREVFIGGEAPVPTAPAKTLIVGTGTQPATAAEPAGDVDWTVEQKLWDEASKRNTIAHYKLYLDQFPQGRFASVARLNIEQLESGVASQVASVAPADPSASAAIGGASVVRTAIAIPDDVRSVPGTATTEALLLLDKEKRVDLQLRLSALGHYAGTYDGALGPRSRQAIGAWQRQSGIVETTYLNQQQYSFLVIQTDPLMPNVRAKYEAEKVAVTQQKRIQTQKVVKRKKTGGGDTNLGPSQHRKGSGGVFSDPAGAAFVGGLIGGAIGGAIGK
jgi:uncharacterized caspase-like protein